MKYLKIGSRYAKTSGGAYVQAQELIPEISWLCDDTSPLYGIGDNLSSAYNCWCPHNLQFDKVRNRFVFVQCHRTKHTGASSSATMHVIHPDDVLYREDIEIPEITALVNLVVLENGTYILYPKDTSAKRYISNDGGNTWTQETISSSAQHFFGIYNSNGEFYAGCDYEWGEYHHSVDGIAWETKKIEWSDNDGCSTKEHAFCFWNNHVYAFGRRDFYVNDDVSQGIADGNNGCAVVFRLDGSNWTMVDDSHLLAFQSNCSPVVFESGIAVAHINRTSTPQLFYSIYDGQNFTTKKTFTNLTISGTQGAVTTPSLAFGNGYACIAFSCFPIIAPLADKAYDRAFNTIFVGTYEGKSTAKYFDYQTVTLEKEAKTFSQNPSAFAFYPSEALGGLTWRWQPSNYDAIVNNNNYDVYYHNSMYPTLIYKPASSDGGMLIYNGKAVDTVVLGGLKTNNISHNWVFGNRSRTYAVSAVGDMYISSFANAMRQCVLECSLSDSSSQPTIDLSDVPDYAMVGKIASGGGTTNRGKTSGAVVIPT